MGRTENAYSPLHKYGIENAIRRGAITTVISNILLLADKSVSHESYSDIEWVQIFELFTGGEIPREAIQPVAAHLARNRGNSIRRISATENYFTFFALNTTR